MLWRMKDTALYATILGVQSPWRVIAVEPTVDEGEIVVCVEPERSAQFCCPKCGDPRACTRVRSRRSHRSPGIVPTG